MLWICLALLGFAAIAAFAIGDGGSLGGLDGDMIAALSASLALLIYIGGSALSSYRGHFTGAARDLTVWIGLVLLLVVGYSFRDEANLVASRVAGELLPPGQAVDVGDDSEGRRAVRIRKRSDGHFVARGRVNGNAVSMLVDTGASSVMLTSSDAGAIGINPSSLRYNIAIQTANGGTYAAAVRLNTIEIGSIVIHDVDALVAKPGSLRESLLGMSFLRRLSSFEFSKKFMTLRI